MTQDPCIQGDVVGRSDDFLAFNQIFEQISTELQIIAICSTMKSVASSTPITQTVDILWLTPGNDACICLTGTKELTSAHSDEFVHCH